ncbi:MAG: hypothetical protein H6933_07820 [Burkholderiaceae bacterium]|nr:hypothetical protein [Burkholderiaceae bacterium]
MDATALWPACAPAHLNLDDHGWLRPALGWWQALLWRPELAPIDQSCHAERRLHAALVDDPLQPVDAARLAKLRDPDARESYGHFLAFRDAVQRAGTLEGWLLGLFRSGRIAVPPAFIDLALQAVTWRLLADDTDAIHWRAGELLFRPQRMARHEGRVLLGDRDTLDLGRDTQGFGELGRLLAEAQAPLKRLDMTVLTPDHAAAYFARAAQPAPGTNFLLDLTHAIDRDLGHGLHFALVHKHSGLGALATVLARWVKHLLGVTVSIEPLQRVDDPHWRWHLGLDAESSALLNDLYEGRAVDPARQERLISLFRLRFTDPAEMRADVAGAPVWLGLMADAEGVVKLKAQNLLLNLPLARDA